MLWLRYLTAYKKKISMNNNSELWTKYTNDNEDKKQVELSKFIYHLAIGLGTKRICEAGCNVGNNISSFPNYFDVHGVDMNKYALEKAKKKYPNFKFQLESIKKTSYPDSFFDLVFTRGILIHIPEKEVDDVLIELLRISKKWIFNLEYFGTDGKMIKWKRGDDLLWYRNMCKRWSKFDVDIISDVDIPQEIDYGKMRFTLVKKDKI